MAEYYPLISRAVAGLREGTPEARRSIYDRATQALVAQLRGMQPPIPEEAIARETSALADAVARVEAEVAPTPAMSGPSPTVAATAPPAETPSLTVEPARRSSGAGPAAPSLGGVRRQDASASPVPRPTLPVRPMMTPLRPSIARPTSPIGAPKPLLSPAASPPVAPPPIAPPVSPPSGAAAQAPPAPVVPPPVAPPEIPSPAAAPAASRAASSPLMPPLAPIIAAVTPVEPDAIPPPVAPATPLPAAPVLRLTTPDDEASSNPSSPLRTAAVVANGDTSSEARNGKARAARADEDAARPPAPRRPVETQRPNLRIWIVAVAALAAVVAVAFTAWRLRDSPEELSRVPAVTKTAEAVAGKIAERADGDTGTADTTAKDTTGASAADTTQQAAAAPAASQVSPDPAIPIAYKAAILVDAPEDPQKVKTYIGTVIWRNENVNQGQDQPLGNGVRADIDIPDAKIQLVFDMRKNIEPQFPASHTLELKFTVGADSPVGSIKQIDVPLLRREEMPTGDALAAVPATITSNYFLVGLTRGGPEDRNLDLIRTRAWFDVPLLLESGKLAKITFEKGTAGDKILGSALQGWSATAN